jgi:glutamate-1-semialdehyde 2,1-aminomutase
MRGEGVLLSGTYSGNPISSAAALAALHELQRPGTYDALFATGRKLMDALRHLFAKAEISVQVSGEPPAFVVWFTDAAITDFRSTLKADAKMHNRFVELLVERGVIKGHEKFFVSTAHTDEDVTTTIEAFESAISQLKAES